MEPSMALDTGYCTMYPAHGDDLVSLSGAPVGSGALPRRTISLLGRMLVVGAGADAQAVISWANRTGMGKIVAQLTCPGEVPVDHLSAHALSSALEVVRQHRPDSAVLAAPQLSGLQSATLARRLADAGLRVFSVPAHAGLIDPHLDRIGPDPVPGTSSGRMSSAGTGPYSNHNILVTGAGGTIGRALCRQLLDEGPRKLILFDLCEEALDTVTLELRVRARDLPVEIVPLLGSVGDAALVARTLRQVGVDVIFHAAAYKHVPLSEEQPEAVFRNNTLGTSTIAQAARDEGVGRFVLISTDKAVRPAGIMGASKRLAEIVVKDLASRSTGTLFSIVRFGNVIGSSGSVVPRFQEQIALGGPVTLTDAEATRFFMTAEDAARLVLATGALARGGDIYALDMGAPHRMLDIAARMIDASGNHGIEVVTTGLRPGEKLHEELTLAEATPIVVDGRRVLRLNDRHPSGLAVAAMMRDLRDALDTGNRSGLTRLATRFDLAVGDDHGRKAAES